jgi:hypothetical protein
MRRAVTYVLSAAQCACGFAVALMLAGGASAHSNPCHSQHTCPSDHHTYVWTDPGTGLQWDCAEPGAPEYDPSSDTTTIIWAGLTYYCRAAGSAPTTTTTATTTASTTPIVPTPVPKQPVVGHTVKVSGRSQMAGCTPGVLPDRQCSPGAYYSGLTKAVLCSPSFRTGTIRNVPDSEKHQVEIEYGMVPKSYGRTIEIDHIVSLEIGGSNDIANLYPEPGSGPANYHVKDRLENKLHALVCSGAITLHAAQVGIAHNWETLYRAVFDVAP